MPILQLIAWLIILGVGLWAMNFLLAPYMEPWILALINKIVIVLVVIMLLWFVLELFGMAPNIAHHPF
jgi:predicted Co/Zn/Cd cation transporter (cation efflux family)